MSAAPAELPASKLARDGATGCLLWIGGRSRGYGVLRVNGRQERAHRVAWMLATGSEIPVGNVVCHRCDVPACCEPSHLFLGTQADDLADMRAKGRARNGEPRRGRLAKATVLRLRADAAAGVPYKVIASKYGVTPQHARAVAVGESRADVPGAVPLRRSARRHPAAVTR